MDRMGDSVIFETKTDFSRSVVWACAVYSLVPFLGIVFVPAALIFGAAALFKGRGSADPNERPTLNAMLFSVFVLAGQIVLWQLLYLIPELRGL